MRLFVIALFVTNAISFVGGGLWKPFEKKTRKGTPVLEMRVIYDEDYPHINGSEGHYDCAEKRRRPDDVTVIFPTAEAAEAYRRAVLGTERSQKGKK